MVRISTVGHPHVQATQALVEKFRARLGAENYDPLVSRYWSLLTDYTLGRFLTARNGNIDLAEQMLLDHLKWRVSYKLDGIIAEDFSDFSDSKEFCWCGFDRGGHPCLSWRPSLHVVAADTERSVRHFCYMLEKGLQMFAPAQQFTLVIDCRGAGRKDIDWKLLKLTAPILENNFPERQHATFVLPVGTVIVMAWKVVATLIDPGTAYKIRLVTAFDHPFLLEHFPPELLRCMTDGDIDAATRLPPPLTQPDPRTAAPPALGALALVQQEEQQQQEQPPPPPLPKQQQHQQPQAQARLPTLSGTEKEDTDHHLELPSAHTSFASSSCSGDDDFTAQQLVAPFPPLPLPRAPLPSCTTAAAATPASPSRAAASHNEAMHPMTPPPLSMRPMAAVQDGSGRETSEQAAQAATAEMAAAAAVWRRSTGSSTCSTPEGPDDVAVQDRSAWDGGSFSPASTQCRGGQQQQHQQQQQAATTAMLAETTAAAAAAAALAADTATAGVKTGPVTMKPAERAAAASPAPSSPAAAAAAPAMAFPRLSGFLFKQRDSVKSRWTYRRRYFLLTVDADGAPLLRYYKSRKDTRSEKCAALAGATVAQAFHMQGNLYPFSIIPHGSGRVLILASDSKDAARDWVAALTTAAAAEPERGAARAAAAAARSPRALPSGGSPRGPYTSFSEAADLSEEEDDTVRDDATVDWPAAAAAGGDGNGGMERLGAASVRGSVISRLTAADSQADPLLPAIDDYAAGGDDGSDSSIFLQEYRRGKRSAMAPAAVVAWSKAMAAAGATAGRAAVAATSPGSIAATTGLGSSNGDLSASSNSKGVRPPPYSMEGGRRSSDAGGIRPRWHKPLAPSLSLPLPLPVPQQEPAANAISSELDRIRLSYASSHGEVLRLRHCLGLMARQVQILAGEAAAAEAAAAVAMADRPIIGEPAAALAAAEAGRAAAEARAAAAEAAVIAAEAAATRAAAAAERAADAEGKAAAVQARADLLEAELAKLRNEAGVPAAAAAANAARAAAAGAETEENHSTLRAWLSGHSAHGVAINSGSAELSQQSPHTAGAVGTTGNEGG